MISRRETLDEIMLKYRTDKSSPYHNYTPVYEYYFDSLRNKEIILLELGIGDIDSLNLEGESILGWREYFINGKCYAIDNNSERVARNTNCFWCDQTDSKELNHIIEVIGRPDIIIDDASHHLDPTLTSFFILFPLLQSKGLYCIEDTVAPSYWPGWEGNENIWDSYFMNYFFNLCHYVNLKKQETFNPSRDIDIPDWIQEIDSIHFHHSQIIIKKK